MDPDVGFGQQQFKLGNAARGLIDDNMHAVPGEHQA